jgi:hypothetical protein
VRAVLLSRLVAVAVADQSEMARQRAGCGSVIVYDSQTRSLLQTDQPGAGISGEHNAVKSNADVSVDVYFGAEADPTANAEPPAPDYGAGATVTHGADNSWIVQGALSKDTISGPTVLAPTDYTFHD